MALERGIVALIQPGCHCLFGGGNGRRDRLQNHASFFALIHEPGVAKGRSVWLGRDFEGDDDAFPKDVIAPHPNNGEKKQIIAGFAENGFDLGK